MANGGTHIEISTSSIAKLFFGLLFAVILYLLRDVLIILLYAIVIASAVSPFASRLERLKIPRLLSVLVLYLLIFGTIVLVASMIIPAFSQELSQLTQVIPKLVNEINTSLDSVQNTAPKYLDFIGELQNIMDVFSSYLQQFSQSAVGLLVDVFGGLFSFSAIIVISFYLAVMKNGIESFLSAVIPRQYEDYAINLWKRAERKVGRWLQGQLLLGLIVGIMVFIGLSLMNIKFALVFAVLAMLLEIVPIVGPVISAFPPIVLGFLQDPQMGFWLLMFFIAVQQFEGHVLVPIVLGKSTGMNPVVVVISLLIGGRLAGLSGAILAVPVASVFVELLDDLAKQKEPKADKV